MMRVNYNKPLTIDERKQIEKLVKQGKNCRQIAELINRSKNAVVVEVRRGGKEKYNAVLAQKDADERHRRHGIKKGCTLKAKRVTFHMKKRIENLEMQIEILHDAIKELMSK